MQVVREYRDELVVRVRLMSMVVTGLLVAIATGFWFVQIVQGDYYRELAENNRLRKLSIKAPRGLIYDRKGRLLVENVPSYNLMIDRSRTTDLGSSLAFVARTLQKPVAELQGLLESYRAIPEFKPVLLAENLTLPEVARLGARGFEHPEFEIEVQYLRLYRHREQLAHVLGYLGEVTQDEVARSAGSYVSGDLVGKKGIEQRYDSLLRGRDGERVVVVDSRGELLEEYGQRLAEPGKNLTLTIDLDLQQEAARSLDGPDKVGAIVAMDPRNGEILALASSPSYNPNLFARRLQANDWRALVEGENHPLQNRAIQNTHSPGSTFKMVMGIAGITEGLVDEHSTAFCPGSAVIYGHTFRCHKAGGHGTVNLHAALKLSCDVYFYQLGQRLGIERIAKYARLFGLGTITGIDLFGEKAGLVPDTAWSQRIRKQPWYPGETISVSIGQGPILVTPLQMATMTAMVANGGMRVTPHLRKDAPVSAPVHVPIDPTALRLVQGGMAAVVNEPGGTAYTRARMAEVAIAGKTGTVQVIGQKARTDAFSLPFKFRDHAWFTSFAPVEDPRIVVAVFAEHGGKGSAVAAPLALALYKIYFKEQGTADAAPQPQP